MVAKLEAYATRYLTPQSRGRVDVAIASIRDRVGCAHEAAGHHPVAGGEGG
jgi:hypothetical protein